MVDERGSLLLMLWAAAAIQVALPALFLAEVLRARSRSRLELLLALSLATAFLAYAYLAQPWAVASVYLRYFWPLALLAAALYALAAWRRLPAWPARGGFGPRLRRIFDGFLALLLAFLALGAYAGRRVPAVPALELAPPLEAAYVWNGGVSPLLNAHYPSRAQRYALDLVALDRWGRRAAGVYPLRLEAYRVYGAPVLSPCDCRVVAAADGHPDLSPGRMDRERIAGNHLVLALSRGGRDYLVVLAHLKRGSVRVRVGDRLRVGQAVARVGSSGNTSEPHLHLHVVLGRDPGQAFRGPGVPVFFFGRFLARNDVAPAKLNGTR